MKFATSRGRPKKIIKDKDLGTKELQQKREYNLTGEPLDILYSRELISDKQYRAGNRLRFLYSLKYGIASTPAYDHTYIAGKNIKLIDLIWLSEREMELEAAISLLKEHSSYDMI